MAICESEGSDTSPTHERLDTELVPGAETESAGDVVKVGGGQSDAELLVELHHFAARKGPGLLGFDDPPSLVESDFHVNICNYNGGDWPGSDWWRSTKITVVSLERQYSEVKDPEC